MSLLDVLVFNGYEVKGAEDGGVGLRVGVDEQFDLILLDVMLPTVDGFSICKEIRKQKPTQGIIIITAKGAEDDVVRGFKSGADDYITKPFCLREVMVGVEAVAALDALVVPFGRVAALVRDHAAFAGTRRRTGHRRTARERGLRFIGQCAEAHTGNVNRNVEHERPLATRSDHGLRFTLFAVTLDDEARERAREEREIVPARNLLEHRKSAHAVTSEFGFHVNVVDHLGGEDRALAEYVFVVV